MTSPATAFHSQQSSVLPPQDWRVFEPVNHELSNSVPSYANQGGGNAVQFSRTKNGPTVGAENRNNSCEEDADIIVLADWANRLSAKEGALLTGMTPNGFKKVQAGDSAISFKKLMRAMRRDPDLAVAIMSRVGLIDPRQAGYAKAMARVSQTINAYERGEFSE